MSDWHSIVIDTDPTALGRFFGDLSGRIDHVMVAAGGPHYVRLADLDRVLAVRIMASTALPGAT